MSALAMLLRRTVSSASLSDLDDSVNSSASFNSTSSPKYSRSAMRQRLEIRIAAFEERCRSQRDTGLVNATYFHSSELPATPVARLAEVTVKGLSKYGVTHETAAWAMVLIERYQAAVGCITPLMMHRLFVCAMWVAIKLHCDVAPSAARMTKICGIAPWELSRMERELLFAIQYNLHAEASDIAAVLKATA